MSEEVTIPSREVSALRVRRAFSGYQADQEGAAGWVLFPLVQWSLFLLVSGLEGTTLARTMRAS